MSVLRIDSAIYLFGIVALPPLVAPVIFTLISQFLIPSNALMSSVGMVAGYLVLLRPLDSLYWSLCFLSDLFLVLAWKSKVIRIPFPEPREGDPLIGSVNVANYNSITAPPPEQDSSTYLSRGGGLFNV
jgi:hypothetical protein